MPKYEKGSIIATGSLTTPVLNDTTLTPDVIIFWVEGTYPSHGVDNGTVHVAGYDGSGVYNASNSIYVHNGSTALMAGYVSAIYAGEFDITFSVYNGSIINFLAVEY